MKAFYNCSKLSNIIIPDSIVEISDFAFYGCKSLTKLPISENNNLKGIYQYAFAYTGITTLVVPDSVIDIDNYAFAGSKLNKVYISNAKQKELVIGLGAFYDCNELKEITLPFIGKSFENDEISWFGYIFGAGSSEANNTYVPESLKKVTINEGISKIGVGGFNKCKNLEIINIPHSVVYISRYAFYETTARYELTNEIAFDEVDSFTCFGKGISGELKIKEGVIELPHFTERKNLISIVIPNTITKIEEGTFDNCSTLKKVSLPESLLSIGDGAFYGCSSLTNINIPNSVTSIGNIAFYNCSSLTNIEIPNGVTRIGPSAFYNCRSLTNIKIPNGVTSIGESAFEDCDSLKNIAIPSSVTSIGSSAFKGCSSLLGIEISNNVTTIENSTFAYCNSLTNVEIPNSVTSIGPSAFEWCSSLTNIIIPNEVTSIGDYAFYDCSGLTSITISESVTIIGNWAFYNCKNLMTIYNNSNLTLKFKSSNYGYIAYYAEKIIDIEGNEHFKDGIYSYDIIVENEFKFVLKNDVYTLIEYLGNSNEITLPRDIYGNTYELNDFNIGLASKVIIPDTFTKISSFAFSGCDSLISIKMPNNISVIENYAFNNCSSLTSIEIPNSVTSIGDFAFYGCSSLTNIEIPNNVASIGNDAFNKCSSLENIIMSEGVTSIGSSAFSNCSSLKNVTLPSTLLSIESYLFEGCILLEKIILSNGITSISNNAFKDCLNLIDVSIPKTVSYISSDAFEGCNKLENLIIDSENEYFYKIDSIIYDKQIERIITVLQPNRIDNIEILDGVTRIESNAFKNCHNLKSIKLPESITNIWDSAFENCSNLISIEIPNSVTYIGYDVFKGCTNLVDVKMPAEITSILGGTFSNCVNLKNIVLPENITSIGGSAFENCGKLENLIIPNSVTNIGNSAFKNCISLTSIEIPNSVTSIGDGAFENCNNMSNIKLSNNVASIGAVAFYNCSNLSSIELPSSVTEIGNGAFENCISLKEIIIPDSVIDIGNGAFEDCKNLTNIKLSSNITVLKTGTFMGCSNLKNIEIPNNTTKIEELVFKDCINLSNITMSKSLEFIGGRAFKNCSSLVNIEIPDNVTLIGSYAFENCSRLKSIELSSGLTITGTYLFLNCDNLENIVLKNGITNISNYAFGNCQNLKSITIPSSVVSIGEAAFINCKKLNNVEISNGVINIGKRAFEECSSLENVRIPNSVTSIGGNAFANCFNLRNIIFSDNLEFINDSMFVNCNKLTSITIPKNITGIGNSAFYNCVNLKVIYNNSNLKLICGERDYGEIAYYAEKIMDKDGNVYYKDDTYSYDLIINEDFLFDYKNGEYILKAYIGNNSEIRLPNKINDSIYKIVHFNNGDATKVIIPNTFNKIDNGTFSDCSNLVDVVLPTSVTSIGNWAFSGCRSLTTINIPSSVTSIGHSAFEGCSSLMNITISNNIEYLGNAVFDDTAFYQDKSNWKDNLLYVGNYLIGVDNGAIAITIPKNTKLISKDAFLNCHKLKSVRILSDKIKNVNLDNLSNLEDITITKIPDEFIRTYLFGYEAIPITLKNITLLGGCEISANNQFNELSNINIYVEDSKEDTALWDVYYKGWNNGNKVYYKGEWINANFYDMNNNLISSDYYSINTVIRQPYVKDVIKDNKKLVFVGWDINDDGIVDNIPATSTKNITAKAIMKEVDNIITVRYFDYYNNELYSQTYNYGDEIVLPTNNPTKKGYTFMGWDGYVENMTVTKDINLYSMWSHLNNGHEYVLTTISPTCETEGYDKYVCSICDYEYHTNIKSKLGHSYNDWIIDTNATCEDDGLRHHICSRCNYNEDEIIPALGHNYQVINEIPSTCTSEGKVEYQCLTCQNKTTETLSMASHNYVKKKVNKTWLQWLIERLLNIFFGYEGDEGFYYQCSECNHIQTIEERNSGSSALSTCDHELKEYETVLEATCDNDGILGRYCSKCNKLVEAKTINKLNHNYSIVEVINPTCTEKGYTKHTCSLCNDSYNDTFTEIIDHTYGKWIEEIPATCESEGIKGHYECSSCHKYFDFNKDGLNDLVINKLGHDLIRHEKLEATCTSIGHEAYDECSRCDYTTYKEIAKKSHDYKVEWSHDENNHYHECNNCDATSDVTNHTFTWIIDNDSTCTEIGLKHEQCSICHYIRNENTIVELKEHVYGTWIEEIPATCENNGVKGHYECNSCHKYFASNKEELNDLVINKLDHNLQHHERLEATCTSIGHEAYDECSRCDYTTYKEIAKKPHDYKDEWSYDENSHYHECKNCDAKDNIINHEFTWIIDKDSTCTETGLKHEECSVCHYIRNENTIVELKEHSYGTWIEEVPATCESNGILGHYKCSNCDKYFDSNKKELTILTITKLGHDLTLHAKLDPTCENNGHNAYYTCSRCDYTTYKVIDKLGHNLVHHEKLEPTCIEDGHEEYDTCTRCNYTTYKTIDKLGHDLTHHERLEATCTSIGHEAYDECSRCDYSTYKEIGMLPHDYKEEWSHDENSHYHECKNCDAKADVTNHTFNWITDKDSTCTETGLKHEECSICHYIRNENTIVELKEHSYGAWIDEIPATCESNGILGHYKCSNCDKYFDFNKKELTILTITKLGHDLTLHAKLDPTCEEDGHNAYYTCSRCDYTTYKVIDKLGHDLTHHERFEATCTSIGHEAYDECSRCDYTTYKEIAKLPHDYKAKWSYDENSHYHECKNCDAKDNIINHEFTWITDKDSTCTETGLKHEECEVCCYIRNENTIVELKEHAYGTWIEEIPATCESNGILGHYKCSNCDKYFDSNKKELTILTITKLGHDLTLHAKLDPTCEEDGHNAYYTCSRCDYTTYKVIDKLGHNLIHHEKLEPTCIEDGHEEYDTCSRCNYTTYKTIDNLDHDLIHHERLEATCTSIGHEAYDECSRCDYTTYKEIAKLPHDYKTEWSHDENSHYHECKNCVAKTNAINHTFTWIIDAEPTEETTGVKHEECETCHYTRNENTIIPTLSHTHNMEHVSRKEATCEEDGNIEYYHCSKCGKNYTDEDGNNEIVDITIKASHKYDLWVEEVSATCEQDGVRAHYECSSCHKYFDINKNEISNLVIDKLGHNLTHHDKLEPTCIEDGYEAYDTCTRCDYTTYKTINKLGHDLVHHERLEATCTSIGHEAYDECSRCDYSTYKEITKLPHDYKEEWSYDENGHYHECRNCNHKEDESVHSYSWVTDKDSTCTETGLKHEECSICHHIRNENTTIELKEHAYGTWIEEVPATCEQDGVKGHYECSNCHKYFDINKNEINNLAINKLGHNLIYHDKLEPTCIKDGYEAYDTCSRCDYTTYKTINKLGHDLIHHERLEATCTSVGHEAYDECSRCDYTTYKEIGMLPHDYKEEWSYDENGHYHECKNCNHKEDESVHSYLWIIDTEPTEETTGIKHEECETCHYTRNENIIIPTLSHTHNMEHISKKEATCEENGNIEYYHCSKCGNNYTDEYGNDEIVNIVIKASHKYGLWVEEVSATCELDGVIAHYECSSCHKYFDINKNEINNLVINKLGHNLIHHERLDPTCTEDGHEEYDTCTRCDYTTYKTINKLGHDLVHHERLDATCTSIGYEAYDECSRCDYSTYKEIGMLPHDYKDEWSYDENGHYHECKNCNHKEDESVHSYTWIIDVEPTEETNGIKHEECSVCHSKRNENTLIEKLDHKHQMEHVSRKKATCEEDGNVEYYHCIKCNKNYVDENCSKSLESIIINAIGHSYGTWIEEISATCEQDGVKAHYECSNCHKYFDSSKEKLNDLTINKLDHNLIHHDKLEPTCIEDGYEEYDTCSRCDYTTYKTIKKLGHDLTHHERLEATCTSIGHEAYDECNRCDYTTYKEIAKLPHDYKTEWSHDENNHYHECKNCDAKADATNHTFTWIIDKDSTCKEEEGLKHEECEVCHYTRNENTVIELKEHTIVVDKAVESTCTSTGLTEGSHCSVCNEVLVKQEITAKKEHTFGEWHVVKEATTTEEGKEERTCSSCNTTETRSIAKITKKGCKGNMATSIITLITCLGILLHFRKKYN